MSFTQFIKKIGKSQYFRQLVIRAIEDAIVLFLIGVGIWAVCWFVGTFFRLLGVG